MKRFVLLMAMLASMLSIKAAEMYVVKSMDESTVTFYYDDLKSSREGTVYGIEEWSNWRKNLYESYCDHDDDEPISDDGGWFNEYLDEWDNIRLAVFNSSFDKARPTNTSYWFCCLPNLENIENIQYLHTSDVMDMSNMFWNCKNLQCIDLRHFDTGNVTNMCGMFGGCIGLISLDLSSFVTNNVTDMSYMFNMIYKQIPCGSSLQSLDVSSFDTGKVLDMHSMFSGCSSLKSIDLSNFDTSNVTSMFCMFRDCSSLKILDLSNFDTSNVTNMYSMFLDCSSLENLNLSSFDTSNVKNMRNIFKGCSSLKSLDLSSFVTDNVWNMIGMFSGCSSLVNLDLSNFDTSNVTDMAGNRFDFEMGMFSGCSSLVDLDLSNFDTSNVMSMAGMFDGCSSLVNLDLSSFDTGNVTDMSNMFSGCSSLSNLNVSSFYTRKVEYMSSMFSGCSSLTSLDLHNFDTSNVQATYYIFSGCSSLAFLDISNFDLYCIDDRWIYNYEEMCKDVASPENPCLLKVPNDFNFLENIDFSGDYFIWQGGYFSLSDVGSHDSEMYVVVSQDGSTVTFYYDKLKSSREGTVYGIGEWQSFLYHIYKFSLKNEITSAVFDVSFKHARPTNTNYWFYELRNLITINNIQNLHTSEVTDMSFMFYNCSNLTNLDLSNFDTSNVMSMAGMFDGCSSLVNLDVSSFDTSNVTDMSFMFYNCSNLTNLDLSNIDTSNVTSMRAVFSGCRNLTSLDLSSFNTSKVTEMKWMFDGCSSLTTLEISNFDISKIDIYGIEYMCGGVASAEHPCILVVPEGFDFREEIDFSGDYFMWQGGYFRISDILRVKPVTVFKGSPSTMAIELKNPSSKKYMGYQFNIVLPEGVSICKKDNGQYSYTQGNRYGNTQMMMNIREQNDGSYMVLCFSLSNTPISGHEGAILSLDITSDGSLDDGSYEGAIRGIKFSTTEDADALLPDATFKVNVSKYELGDVNNDGSVSITDITMAVNYILGKASDKFHASHGDMNHDGEINISDLSEMVEIILNSGNNAPVNIGVTGGLRMESAGSECSLYLPDAGLYKGCQFLVRVPSGCRLSDVSVGAGRESGHRVMFRQTGTGLYKVLVFSADGNEFEDVPSALLRLTVDGQNGGAVELSDIRFTDTDFTEHSFAAVSSEVTGIGAVAKGVSESTWYSLDGQKTAQPTKGVFVRDGRKIVVK